MTKDKYTIEEIAARFDLVMDDTGLSLVDNQTSQLYRIKEGDSTLPEQRRLAMDAALQEKPMPNKLRPNDGNNLAGAIRERFGADADAEPMDPETLLHFVQLCLGGLDGPERAEFVGNLAALVQAESGANDARMRRSGGRRPAQDAALRQLNNKSFQDRFPFMKNVRTSGY
jgi:hypothetical protein